MVIATIGRPPPERDSGAAAATACASERVFEFVYETAENGMAKKRRGIQKGAQEHDEGQHGPKARAAFIAQLHARPREPDHRPDGASHDGPGKHRLFERREQHDEAELNSEKNRLSRDITEHGHVRENFQVRGGAESHPALPRSHINPGDPDAPNPSDRLDPAEVPTRVPGYGAS